ncbi:phosphoglucosamine mutase [Tanacetum coccineum]
MEDETLVRKLLNAVPDRFLQIVASIEQYSDLDTMSLDEAIGRLKTFEERLKYKNERPVNTQEGLSERKNRESSQNNFKKETHRNSNKFTHDKSKVLCFKCKEYGHFANKCPSKKEEQSNLIEDDFVPQITLSGSSGNLGWWCTEKNLDGGVTESMSRPGIKEDIYAARTPIGRQSVGSITNQKHDQSGFMIDHNNKGGSNQKNMINLDLRKITTTKVEVTEEEKNDLPGCKDDHKHYKGSKKSFLINTTLSVDDVLKLQQYCEHEDYADYQTERGKVYSQPMVWIGIYIAIASLVCTLAMAADLLHVITVAMKLPVDLTSEMPGNMDQTAKLGSLAFMCTIMVNLMPSLASMDNKTLLANVIGLSILVITIIVNICIQIHTHIIDENYLLYSPSRYIMFIPSNLSAFIYAAMILLLLIITISSSLTIPTSKEILEFKYQATHKTPLTDQQQTQMSLVEKLRQHVRRFWVMAETGSPQFVMASSPLSTASGVICVFVLLMQTLVMYEFLYGDHGHPYGYEFKSVSAYGSVYKRSTLFIVVTQSIGVVVGNIAPMFRCFSVLSFKLVTRWDRSRFMAIKVEKHWTQKLYEWKQYQIPILLSSRRSRIVLYNLKNMALSLCIVFQKPSTQELAKYTKTLVSMFYKFMMRWSLLREHSKGISNSMNSFILKAEKVQNNILLELLENSNGFDGVEKFDTVQIQPLHSVELVNSWSLAILTLTCIAVALPRIPKDVVENLVKSVGEGLSYTHLVEESLNVSSEYVNIRKATINLWHEVENNCKWLKNTLSKNDFEGKTTLEILNWFAGKSEAIVIKINKSFNGKMMEKVPEELIAANSMYRIAQTILLRDQSNTEPLSIIQLFAHLNGMIADILFASLTNIPRVITMKCHESMIEKREASVKVAAKLLGKTTKILERLETLELPSMDDDKMAYIDEWRLHFNRSIP